MLEPRDISRFGFSVKLAFASNVPPFKVRCPAVGEPGTAPKPLSTLILIVPPLIVVEPA